jgi:hypothetical protein
MKKQNKYLTEESFTRALKKIEEDAEWELRHPTPRIWYPKEIEILKKMGFFKENRGKNE